MKKYKRNIQGRNIGFPDGVSYKKPFYEVPNGYGYEGVLLVDKDTNELQCHICGQWWRGLSTHLQKKHKLTQREYKDTYGLDYQTALISEDLREQRIQDMTPAFIQARKKGLEKSRETISTAPHNGSKRMLSLERMNRQGSCELQVMNELEKISKKLGRQPYVHEMINDKGTNISKRARARFGSIDKVRSLLTMKGYLYQKDVNENGHLPKRRINKETLINALMFFKQEYGRQPVVSDLRRGLLYKENYYKRVFGSWGEAKKAAFNEIPT